MLTTNSSTKTGRLITILNWEKYQGRDYVSDKGNDKEPTKSRQRPDKEPTTNKNDKEYKNDKEIYIRNNSDLKSKNKNACNIQQSGSRAKPTGFSNFEQRDYDVDKLEQQLLDAQKGEKE